MTGDFRVVTIAEHQPMKGKDRIISSFVNGEVIIINKEENPVGTRGILFDCESRINEKILHELSLYRDKAMNKNPEKSGFFFNNRVKPQNFGGVKCSGFFLSFNQLSEIDWLSGIEELEDGHMDTAFNNEWVSKKWIPPRRNQGAANSRLQKKKKKTRVIDGHFAFHKSTGHLGDVIGFIKPDDIIGLSHKLHGTSFISSNVLCRKKINPFMKIATLGLYRPVHYDNIYSSRSVIKNDWNSHQKSHFYSKDIWGECNDRFKQALEKGISVFGEITGFVGESYIQKGYDYGSSSGESKCWVYRITHTDRQGNTRDFSTPEIREYCDARGWTYVPHIYHGPASEYFHSSGETGYYGRNLFDHLSKEFLEFNCPFCVNDVPVEGIVLRVETTPDVWSAFKLKSFAFRTRESNAKVADIETEN